MELVSQTPEDAISELLRLVKVRTTVYCRSLMSAAWGFGVQAHGNPAFHVVVDGECWLHVDGQPGQLRLARGDLVLLPTGAGHRLRDHPDSSCTDLEDMLTQTPPDAGGRLSHGGGGSVTELICGGFALDGGDAHPVMRALPPVIQVRALAGEPPAWLAATLDMLSAEAASRAPGAQVIVSRLADVLLSQALRVALAQLQSQDPVLLAALRDPRIAGAVQLIHRYPERAWTVAELAQEVALARSTFAVRFRELVGEPPSRYLTRARLAHGATLLHTTDATLAEIALRTGYASEFSFSKAFKRAFGLAPGAYRGQDDAPVELAVGGRDVAGVAAVTL
jgi:AraC family transcriptional regulator, alkane utilization regulator